MHKIYTTCLALAAGAVVALAPVAGAQANLVTNGGFETGDTTGWSLTGDTSFTGINYSPNVHSGAYALDFGEVYGDGILTQSVPTNLGSHYTFSFWLANDGNTPTDFSAKWNGSTLMSLTDAPGFGYTQYAFDVIGAAGSSMIEIDAYQVPAWFHLDDISVAPEPASLGVLGVALVGLGLIRRRRQA